MKNDLLYTMPTGPYFTKLKKKKTLEKLLLYMSRRFFDVLISNLLTEFALLALFCSKSQFNWLVTKLKQVWFFNQDSNAKMVNIFGLSTLNYP